MESPDKDVRNYGKIDKNQFLVQVYHSDEDCYYVSLLIWNEVEMI